MKFGNRRCGTKSPTAISHSHRSGKRTYRREIYAYRCKSCAGVDGFKTKLTETIAIVLAHERADTRQRIATMTFPVATGYEPGKFYLRGSIVVAGGGCYQAREDTSFAPGHSTWNLLAAPGASGEDGRSYDDEHQRGRSVIDLPDFRRRNGHGG